MYVEKRGEKFLAIERYKDKSGKVRRVSVTMDRNTAQSRRAASEQLAKKIAGRNRKISDFTFSEAKDAYVKWLKITVKPQTVIRNECSLKRIMSLTGDIPMDDLTAGRVMDALIGYKNKPVTVNQYIKRFKAFIRWAYKNDYISSTICIDKLDNLPDKTKRERIADKYLEPDELKTVLIGASDYYRNIIEFMVLTGMRIGEVVALYDSDVDLKNKTITINKTYSPVVGQIGTPKTPTSEDVISIQPELVPVIKRIRMMSNANRIINRKPRERVFIVNQYGTHMSYEKFSREFKDLTERTIGRRLTPHSLRHTHASMLAAAGVPLDVISRRLRHADSKVTKEIYLHVTEKLRESDAAALASVRMIAN